MKHLLTKNYNDILMILNDFFLKGYTRKSLPEYNTSYNKELFDFACQIYKRGFVSQKKKEDSKHLIPLPTILSQTDFLNFLQNLNISNVFYFVDENLYAKQSSLTNFLKDKKCLLYKPDESTKCTDTVNKWIEILPNETQLIIVMGGGIILDIVGFIAGLLKIKIYYLPTTLLSSVDAGIGGKTGVNFYPYGKNQIGLFYEAEKLFCVPEYFQTLSQVDIICGLAEAIKHSWIFGEFLNDYDSILKIYHKNSTIEDFFYLISKSIKYKSTIVNLDLYESKDIRTSLNFGHTLAHIIEALAEDHSIQFLPHGIAVAHGLHFIFQSGLVSFSNDQQNMINLIKDITYKYPIIISNQISQIQIEKYLVQDKKNEDASLCALSLPSYGQFSLINSEPIFSPVTKKFPVSLISKLMFEYITSI
ncbi:hypothetical protein [Silvanigrella sp.]|jgi:3-dehydroquinate synthase|uniref:3-dehydroquinate synthase family protein n=1 Tax=Silvanigrella sp. TaxID=2024976 RepID=UPI0037CAB574